MSMEFVPVAKPQTESELAVMLSLLEAHGIPHFVHNRGFGSLYPGMQIDLYNVRRFMVAENHAQEALDLLAVFLQPSAQAAKEGVLTLRDRVRVVFETLVFSWSFPRKRRRVLQDIDENS